MSFCRFLDVLCGMGMVEQIIALLQTEHNGAHEHLMAALLCLVERNIKAIQECLRPELNLQSYLQTSKQSIADKEEFMVRYLAKIIS